VQVYWVGLVTYSMDSYNVQQLYPQAENILVQCLLGLNIRKSVTPCHACELLTLLYSLAVNLFSILNETLQACFKWTLTL